MHKAIYEALQICGVPQNVKGYNYLMYAVECVLTNEEPMWQATKWLYPTIAKKFNTTVARVDRDMRHAVARAFENASSEELKKIFGNTIRCDRDRVTLSQFIAAVAKYVQYQI